MTILILSLLLQFCLTVLPFNSIFQHFPPFLSLPFLTYNLVITRSHGSCQSVWIRTNTFLQWNTDFHSRYPLTGVNMSSVLQTQDAHDWLESPRLKHTVECNSSHPKCSTNYALLVFWPQAAMALRFNLQSPNTQLNSLTTDIGFYVLKKINFRIILPLVHTLL